MTKFIPIFPLGIVAYPGEALHLHIFEPRYKQLIQDCKAGGKPFGIPTVIDGRLQDYGTTLSISEVTKEYDGGEMDIKTRGEGVFRILSTVEAVPDKLYGGAIVNYPDNHTHANPAVMARLLPLIDELHKLLGVTKDFRRDAETTAYDVAHHIGLSLQEEYELLVLLDERQRQEYIRRHLAKVVPMMAEMEALKEKIKLNGHFKHLPGLNWKR